MSYWDSENGKIIHLPDTPAENYSGWTQVDCGCCDGIQWGGEYPRECQECGGTGVIYRHNKSGVLALYPGGPFVGKGDAEILNDD